MQNNELAKLQVLMVFDKFTVLNPVQNEVRILEIVG